MDHPKSSPEPYEWDFDGACAPTVQRKWMPQTFSLGIFQWIPKAGGKGLKRGKVMRRIRGGSDPERAAMLYRDAQRIIDRLNAAGATDGDFA